MFISLITSFISISYYLPTSFISDEVSGGNTQETCIIDPECIIKVEKLKPSDVIGLDDTLWSRGSDLTKKDFIDWYKELIDKRKKSKER